MKKRSGDCVYKNHTLPVLTGLWILLMTAGILLSCGTSKPNEETLLLYARASMLYRESRFPETIKMLSGERRFVPALVLRGKAEFFSNDDTRAEKTLSRALALSPGNIEAALYLSRILWEKGKAGEAKILTEKILGDDPQNIRALRLSAELVREGGSLGDAEAMVYLDRAAEASSETALVFLDRARIRWIRGEAKAALEDLGRAGILLPPDSPLARSVTNLESIINGQSGRFMP